MPSASGASGSHSQATGSLGRRRRRPGETARQGDGSGDPQRGECTGDDREQGWQERDQCQGECGCQKEAALPGECQRGEREAARPGERSRLERDRRRSCGEEAPGHRCGERDEQHDLALAPALRSERDERDESQARELPGSQGDPAREDRRGKEQEGAGERDEFADDEDTQEKAVRQLRERDGQWLWGNGSGGRHGIRRSRGANAGLPHRVPGHCCDRRRGSDRLVGWRSARDRFCWSVGWWQWLANAELGELGFQPGETLLELCDPISSILAREVGETALLAPPRWAG
jgi:hypothetical protein